MRSAPCSSSLAALLLVLPSPAAAQQPAAARDVRQALAEFATRPAVRDVPCLVLGALAGDERVVLGRGKVGDAEADGRTLFEIGSISKVFTAVCLASLAADGVVSVDDPVQRWLPDDVRLAQVGARPITLADLATHRSGLPRLPANLAPADPANPYADYDAPRLLEALAALRPARAPGDRYEYSNLGVGLLGFCLTRAAKAASWEDLVVARVCAPLGLDDTRVHLDDARRARLAQPRDRSGEAVPPWDFDALAGAGALRSTANDLLRFLAANLGRVAAGDERAAAVLPALREAHRPRVTDSPRTGLGWHFAPVPARGTPLECLWHNGGTAGTSSFVGFVPETQVAVVMLATRPLRSDAAGIELLRAVHEALAAPAPAPAPAPDAAPAAATPTERAPEPARERRPAEKRDPTPLSFPR